MPVCPCTAGAGNPGSSGIGTAPRSSPEERDHAGPARAQHDGGLVVPEALPDRVGAGPGDGVGVAGHGRIMAGPQPPRAVTPA